jgi:hypothetical protein
MARHEDADTPGPQRATPAMGASAPGRVVPSTESCDENAAVLGFGGAAGVQFGSGNVQVNNFSCGSPAQADDGGAPWQRQIHAEPNRLVVGAIPGEPAAFVARGAVGQLARAAATTRVAVVSTLTGMSGVGKSQVAAAYARMRIAEGWHLVGWVNAESADGLVADLGQIADRLGLAGSEEGGQRHGSAESAARLREYLNGQMKPGLLVFDNATDPDILRPFLPATGGTQVVVTSRNAGFSELGVAVDVSVFSRRESVKYLANRTGLKDAAGADAVASEVADLPLALAQAAATIRRQRLTYSGYLERMGRVAVGQLLGRVQGGAYPHGAAAALLLQVQTVEAGDPECLSGQILRVVAVLSPAGVRRELLTQLVQDASGGDSALQIDAALEECTAQSVLTWSENGRAVLMHRLLGRVLRERDQASGRWESTIALAMRVLLGREISDDQPMPPRETGEALVAHAEAMWALWGGASDKTINAGLLRGRRWAVEYLAHAEEYQRATALGTQVVTDCERILGPDHPETLNMRDELTLAECWDEDKTVDALIATLAVRKRVLGTDHPDTLRSIEMVTGMTILYGVGANDDMALHEEARAAHERVYGVDHPHTLKFRNRFANACRNNGRTVDAIALHEAIVADCTRMLGADHPLTLETRMDLGMDYREAGRLADAIALDKESLAIAEQVHGSEHRDALVFQNNLALVYVDAGRYAEAAELLESTCASYERLLGADHPQTVHARKNLAWAYQQGGRLDEAITLLKAVLANEEKTLGRYHQRALKTKRWLAKAYQAAGRPEEVRALGADGPLSMEEWWYGF